MAILWIKFLICAGVVVFFGYQISVYAEKIARIAKVSHSFVGLILLAVVTSLPELAVTLSATKLGALDLALGDLFGSNLFNITIVGLLFLIFVKQPKRISVSPSHFIGLGFSVLLMVLAAMGIIFYKLISPGVSLSRFFLDVETALIFVIYLFGAYLILKSERKAGSSGRPSERLADNLKVWLKFLLFSAILVSSAIYLSRLGDAIARMPVRGVALGGTFVGSLLIAVTTSLPEATVAVSAVKLGLWDMALANIFGSNMFNMWIIAFTDLALARKVILSCVSGLHLLTILFALASSALVCASLVYRSRKETPGLAWDSASIIFIYFAANISNFYLR